MIHNKFFVGSILLTIIIIAVSIVFRSNIFINRDDETKISQVSLGNLYTLALAENGKLFAYGDNNHRQFPFINSDYIERPMDITNEFKLTYGDKFKDISAGTNHSVVLSKDGRVFEFGDYYFWLSIDEIESRKGPIHEITENFKLDDGDKIKLISAEDGHIVAVSEKGKLFLIEGHQIIDLTNEFTIDSNDEIIKVDTGHLYTILLTKNGKVYTFGNNNSGQLGNGTTENEDYPIDITSGFSLVDVDKIIDVSAGGNFASAISDSGKVFTWGYNAGGGIGTGDEETYLSPIEITDNFELNDDKIIKSDLGSLNGLFLSEKGEVFILGEIAYRNEKYSTDLVKWIHTPSNITSKITLSENDKIVDINAGGYSFSLISDKNKVYAVGRDYITYQDEDTDPHDFIPIDITDEFPIYSLNYIGIASVIVLLSTSGILMFYSWKNHN